MQPIRADYTPIVDSGQVNPDRCASDGASRCCKKNRGIAMPEKSPGWEGTILAFVMIATVLIGVAYSIALVYATPIPWAILLVIAAIAAFWLRRRGRT
jgi:Flp pilus assembly protein TadB